MENNYCSGLHNLNPQKNKKDPLMFLKKEDITNELVQKCNHIVMNDFMKFPQIDLNHLLLTKEEIKFYSQFRNVTITYKIDKDDF